MKNETLAVVSTDWHIDANNVELSLKLAKEMISLAKSRKCKTLYCLGDVFDSKRAQPEIVLNTFEKILDDIHEEGMVMTCIAGNHDKTDPSSCSSFLTPFENHPALNLIDDASIFSPYEPACFVFLPYFKEDLFVEKLSRALHLCNNFAKRYLFAHIACNGAVNNDGSKVDNKINAKLLSTFDMCWFGHYHDEQFPLPNVHHLSSWKQSNFGENDDKGFYTLERTDEGALTMIHHQSTFPLYVTHEIDASELTSEIVKDYAESVDENVRLRLTLKGDASVLKGVDTDTLVKAGIKIKKVNLTKEEREKLKNSEFDDYASSDVLVKAFREFCETNDWSFEEGYEYLKEIL